MDYILTKTFVVESLVIGAGLYKFPFYTFFISGAIFAYVMYSNSRKVVSNKINQINQSACVYDFNNQWPIRKISIPKFGSNELLVQVKAAALNPVDYKIKTINLPFYRWFAEPTVGRDFSGVVIDVGSGVSKFKVGDEVYGNAAGGSLLEYSVVKEKEIGHKPSNISFEECASIGLAAGTSLQALKFWGDLQGKKILIVGASGGCGSLGVQIAKYYKSTVFAICGSRNVDYVKSLGPDEVLDYTKPDYLTGLEGQNFDLIYDTVTSPEDEDQEKIYRKFLGPNGKYVAINARPSDFARGIISISGINIERKDYHVTLLRWNTEDLNLLGKMAEEGKLRSKFTSYKFTSEDIRNAFGQLQSRRTVGKLVIQINNNQ
jgi:NADPH:quinone reductase-like Zn-dependent oxidoreductase